jgi:hypothetical protein
LTEKKSPAGVVVCQFFAHDDVGLFNFLDILDELTVSVSIGYREKELLSMMVVMAVDSSL